MEQNEYDLIHFSTNNEYQKATPLLINPQPDSLLRVFMVYQKATGNEKIQQQNLSHLKLTERKGLTVIEWGGTYFD